MTAGISTGILAGRIVGGWLNDEIGWRGMFLVFATACVIVAVSAFFVLPGAAGVSWQAHLGGAVGGVVAARYLHRRPVRPVPARTSYSSTW